MAWVKWETICLPKDKGGLGVKNLEVFNVALLTKWRWRVLVEDGNPIWKEVLKERYDLKERWPEFEESRRGWGKKSLWWRDLCLLGEGINLQEGWFEDLVKIKLGKGNKARFWRDAWNGRDTLAELFPELYDSCRFKEALVEEHGQWRNGRWSWKWDWAESLLLEQPQMRAAVVNLQQLLRPVLLTSQCSDRWIWIQDSLVGFTVKKCYESLLLLSAGGLIQMPTETVEACKKVWKNDVPSKIQVFSWRVILNRVATRVELNRRGLIQHQNDLSCALCLQAEETTEHLFLSCRVAKRIWENIYAWMGVPMGELERVVTHFMEFGNIVKGKNRRGLRNIIWMAVMWNIWLARNKVIFKGEATSVHGIIAGSKDLAWSWFKARRGRNCRATWSDWYNCPLGCLAMV